MQDPDTSGPKDPHTEILKERSCTSCPTILIQRSRTSAPIGSWYSGPKDLATEILHKCSYRIQMQMVQRIIHTEILKQRSCTSCPTGSWYRYLTEVVLEDPDTVGQKILTEILYKCSYRILIQVVQRILTQRSCTSCPTGSWYRDLAQVRLQDPDTVGQKILLQAVQRLMHTEILKQRSCTSCLTGSWYRDLAQVVLEVPDTRSPKDTRSCASGPIGSWYKWSKRILIQRWYRDLAQMLMQDHDTSGPKDPHTEILKQRSCTNCPTILIQRSRTSGPIRSWYSGPKDPATEILHKCSYRILIQVVQRIIHTEILKQRSCTSGPTGSWYRDLAQVVLEDPDTSGSKASWYEILCKWSYRILIQVVRILIQKSCYKCRADLLSLLVGVRSHTLFGVSCRDNLLILY